MATAKELAILISGSDKASPALRQLQGDLKGVATNTQQAGEAAQKASGGFGSLIAQGAKLGAGFVGVTSGIAVMQKLGSSITDTIKNASDLNETINKSQVVFGTSSAAVKAFAETAASSMGQSQQQALSAAATFGNLFKTMGMGQKATADMSVATVKLASDLASFHNIGIDEALQKLRSGLVGEAEPMRQLGVLLDETTVKAKAAEMGFKGINGELTQSEKVQARYAIILEQTKDSQGDFARTSDGMANASRIVDASMADLSATIGTELLPVAAKIVSGFAKELPGAITETRKFMEDVRPVVSLLTGGMDNLGKAIAAIGGYSNIAKLAMQGLAPEFAAVAEGFRVWNEWQKAQNPVPVTTGTKSLMGWLQNGGVGGIETPIKPEIYEMPTWIIDDWEHYWEVRNEGAKAAEEAEKKANQEAKKFGTEAQNAYESATKEARNLARTMDDEVAQSISNLARINEDAGNRWITKWGDIDAAIRQAQQSAQQAKIDLWRQEDIAGDASRRRTQLSESLSNQDRIFNQRMDDEEFHHREALQLNRIAADEEKALQRAQTEREKDDIRNTANERREQLRLEHLAFDEEVKWRIGQEDKVIGHRKEQERQRAGLESTLHAEEIKRRLDAVDIEAEKKIKAANDEWTKFQADEAAKTAKLAEEEKARAASKLAALKEGYFDKLADSAAGGLGGLKSQIESKFGEAIAAVTGGGSAAVAAAVDTAGNWALSGGMSGTDPEHAPGGSIYESWVAAGSPDYNNLPIMDNGGTVAGRWGSLQPVLARGGEVFSGFPPRSGAGVGGGDLHLYGPIFVGDGEEFVVRNYTTARRRGRIA